MNLIRKNWDDHKLVWRNLAAGVILGAATAAPAAWAGVFNIPHFVTPGEFALGIEPELHLTGGTNAGANIKYTHGLTDINNLVVTAGMGGTLRGFRLGGAFTFDIFPDFDRQPGIGIAAGALFVQLPNTGSVEVTGTPYIHKTFRVGADHMEIEPFFAVPLGLALAQGTYQALASLVFGSMFQHSEHIRSSVELGVGVNNNTNTYLSGGVTYYH